MGSDTMKMIFGKLSQGFILALLALGFTACEKAADPPPASTQSLSSGTKSEPDVVAPESLARLLGKFSMRLNAAQKEANKKLMQQGLPQMVGSLEILADGSFKMSTSGGMAVILIEGKATTQNDEVVLTPERINGQNIKVGADAQPTVLKISADNKVLTAKDVDLTYERITS